MDIKCICGLVIGPILDGVTRDEVRIHLKVHQLEIEKQKADELGRLVGSIQELRYLLRQRLPN